MYSSSHGACKEATITFLLLPGMLHFQRSKEFHPNLENVGATCKRLAGMAAIKGCSGFTLCLFQYEHWCRIFLTVAREFRTQYCCLNSFCTCSTPSCLSFSWQFIIMRQLRSWSGDNTIGCRPFNSATNTNNFISIKERGKRFQSTLIWDVLVSLAISRGKYSISAVTIQNFRAHSNSYTKNGPIWRPVLWYLQL